MKTVQFTNIHIEHFGKHGNIQSKLGHRTVIEGANATGKSTIKRAIQYILGTKDENGKEISGIRPHDENGVDIDGLTTVAELTVSVDGVENKLKRTCFQEKNRQQQYTGKDNLQYYVDDVKKGTKKAYDEYVSTIIPATVCISAQELLMKDAAGRRAMLEVFSKHDTDSIIDENKEFEPLRGKLRANTVADLKKSCRDRIKEKTKQRDAYPARIDEVEKQKVDIDLAELELLKNSLNEQIAENKAKQADASKQFDEYDRQSKDILDLQFALSDLERKANEDLIKQRREIEDKIAKVKHISVSIERVIKQNEDDISLSEKRIEHQTKLLNELREKYTQAQSLEFDENSLVCPYCGNEYKEDKKEEKRRDFENKKAEDLSIITASGEHAKDSAIEEKQNLIRLKNELSENKKSLERANAEIADLEQKLSALPQSIDISDREDVKKLKKQIAEKEQAMQKGNSASEIRQQLQDEYERLSLQVAEVVGKINLSVKNDSIDERVAELKKQQLALSQEIADVERELDLLKFFERRKAELLENDVNSHFSIIRWKMFKEMQNGELADICSPFVGGTSYDGNLNKGARILVQLDICLSFQKLYDVQMPVLLDDGESVDSWRIPQVENQLIIFKRTDDKELKIECLEG